MPVVGELLGAFLHVLRDGFGKPAEFPLIETAAWASRIGPRQRKVAYGRST
jgi:hypothetical protein